jgi:hypothetical protein
MVRLERQEWLWLVAGIGCVLAFTNLPYLYGALQATPDAQFGGFIIGVEDGYSYLAKMQEGRAGHWLFYLAYTPEAHRPGFFFIYYLLLGKLAGLFNLDLLSVLNFQRIAAAAFGLGSFYVFTAYFITEIRTRRIALLLYGLTAGLGWLWVALGWPAGLNTMPVDLWVPEASFFLAALTFPHLALAQGLLLLVVVAGLKFFETGRWRWWAAAAGAGLAASLIHPYKLLVLSAVFGVYLLWLSWQGWSFAWREGWDWGLIIAPSLPYLIYTFLTFETNFAFRAWRDQNQIWSPPPLLYLLGFGLILPLAALGGWHSRHERRRSFLIVWSVVIPFLLYFPNPLQRRFLDGYQAPLVVLAAVGAAWLLGQLPAWGRRLALTASWPLLTLTNVILLGGAIITLATRPPSLFHPSDRLAAFEWLAQHAARQEVVVAAYEVGNALPAYAPVKVFVGHGPESYRASEKRQLLRQFFAADTDDAWRRALLAEYGVDYVYFGPDERRLGEFIPANLAELELGYANDTVEIYRVHLEPEETPSS